ncbi:lipase family protein [Spirillospora sp. NPDC047279]|uniref:lipase family protein n=1 Tax=Spirillospora sp. NPDC047279 TaxID=3155478 RepID=UPI0033C5B9B9
MLDIVVEKGHRGVTTAEVAERAGTREPTVLYHFPSKDHLLVAALRRSDEEQAAADSGGDADADLPARLRAFADSVTRRAGVLRLYAALAGEATTPGHPAQEYFAQRYAATVARYAMQAVPSFPWTGAARSASVLSLASALAITAFVPTARAHGPAPGSVPPDQDPPSPELTAAPGIGKSNPWTLNGYSGGANATGWAAQLQPAYAPDVTLKGIAMGGTPADPERPRPPTGAPRSRTSRPPPPVFRNATNLIGRPRPQPPTRLAVQWAGGQVTRSAHHLVPPAGWTDAGCSPMSLGVPGGQHRYTERRWETSMAKVRWHLMMSLDGFAAGPGHSLEWMSGVVVDPDVHRESIASLGAVLGGRRGYDALAEQNRQASKEPYGGAWSGPVFVLTHHPEDAVPDPGVTFLNCDVAEAVEIGLAAADGKDLELHSQDIARQCVERGLIDEFRVHLAPIMLGSGVRLFDCPGIEPVRWARIHDGHPAQAVDLRYRRA